MPWFRNKKTGLVWEITDREHAARLEKDPDYERVPDPTAKKAAKRAKVDDGGDGRGEGEGQAEEA